jgi:aryl-alcohol dehydrogenase-like predicted oxidoreductase
MKVAKSEGSEKKGGKEPPSFALAWLGLGFPKVRTAAIVGISRAAQK